MVYMELLHSIWEEVFILVHHWVRVVVGNGRKCLFWTDNWSSYGNLRYYLGHIGAITAGIRSSSTLSDLWIGGRWILPPARSEEQVNL